MNKVYVGDVGTIITLDCGEDISSATTREILVRKPDGTLMTWTAVASGPNGIAFTAQADTLDQAGKWKLQAKIVLPTGNWKGQTTVLTVYPSFA
jgi:hypothetical protein